LDKRFPEKNIKVDKEIDFDTYKNDIEDYIKDKNNITNQNSKFNNNGAFLLFINLISYIYINNPFNRENMNFCKFLKNKFLLKVPKKPNKIENILNSNNSNTNNTNTNNTTNKEKDNNKNTINANINENSDKDLQLKNKGKNRSNSLYNSKMKKNNHNVNTEKKQNNNELFDIHKKIVSTKELNLFHPSNKKTLFSDVTKSDKEKNKDNKNTDFLAFSMNLNELKKEKLRSFRKEKNDNLTPPKNKKPELNLEQESDETKNNDYADILYKNCEEDSSKFIKKYYGELRGKDILFFTSKLKNELCTIWNISKCIIIPLEKINISKYNYFPIKFINYNQSFCLIYFEEQEKRNIFLKKCEENTSYIKIEDLYEFKEKIGEGHFGLVKRCIEKSTGKEYAVKIMNKNKIKKKDLQFLIQERNYMMLIKHPNIVSLIQDYEDENCLYFVMEYFKGGDLSKYMRKIIDNQKEKNLERIGARIIKIIAQGVEYLNQFGIVHRDLKPENIVFGIEDDIKSIKIIDLGVAITLPFGQQSSEAIGTLAYIAPEMYTHTPYTYKVDVWSIGILLYWLTSGGVVPFDDEKNDESIMGKKVVFMHQEYPEKYFGDKSKSLINLIDKALEKNPEKRINIHAFLSEEWLNKYNK
jgi:doublecortin-like kinase 1/2